MPEVDVKLLIRAARSRRDRVILETLYAGGLRISELVGLSWADVIARDAKVQLSVTGKGGRTRQVLLPAVVSQSLLALRGDVGANDPVFASHKGARRLTERTVGYMLKRTAKRAGIAETVSPNWLRHAHSTAAPRSPKCRRPSAPPTSRRPAATFMRGPIPQAASSWTRAFFVDEDGQPR